ncbi:MAG: hypothetical protein IJM59_02595, partial [Proteobacteria bacterium]|nr:hypothetical protein [Pseudomonadota bacterium]
NIAGIIPDSTGIRCHLHSGGPEIKSPEAGISVFKQLFYSPYYWRIPDVGVAETEAKVVLRC